MKSTANDIRFGGFYGGVQLCSVPFRSVDFIVPTVLSIIQLHNNTPYCVVSTPIAVSDNYARSSSLTEKSNSTLATPAA